MGVRLLVYEVDGVRFGDLFVSVSRVRGFEGFVRCLFCFLVTFALK